MGSTKLAEDAAEAAEAVVETPAALFAILEPAIWCAGIGGGLLFLRWFFLESAPDLADTAVLVTVFVDSITTAIGVIGAAVTTIISIGHLLFGGKVAPPVVHFVEFTPTQIKAFLSAAPVVCQRYGSVGTVLGGIIVAASGNAVCPILRYLYPIAWLNPIATATIGWMATGPDPEGNNCAPEPDDEATIAFCLGLGAGYIILEVLLPLLLVAIVFKVGIPALKLAVHSVFALAEISQSDPRGDYMAL